MRPIARFNILLLALACCSCTKKSTAPDPNTAMYGTWSGVLRDTVQTAAGPQPQQLALQLQFGPRGVTCTIDGTAYAAIVEYMRDPDVHFLVASGQVRSGFSGTRAGDALSGEGSWLGGNGTWTVLKFAGVGVADRSP